MKRPSRRSTGIALGIGALGIAGLLVSIQAAPIGVTVYEDAGGLGDHLLTEGIAPNYPKRANLTLVTTGLVNGCNRGINQSSTWNDCISSARVSSLPPNTKLQFFQGINYGSTLIRCWDADGSSGVIDLTTVPDVISSFRVVGGNC